MNEFAEEKIATPFTIKEQMVNSPKVPFEVNSNISVPAAVENHLGNAMAVPVDVNSTIPMEFDIASKFIPQPPKVNLTDKTHKIVDTVQDIGPQDSIDEVSLYMKPDLLIQKKTILPMEDKEYKSIARIFGQEKQTQIPFSVEDSVAQLRKTGASLKNTEAQIRKILNNEKGKEDFIDGKFIKNKIDDFLVDDRGSVFRVRKDKVYEEVSSYNIQFLSIVKRVEVDRIETFLKILAQNNSEKLVLTVGLDELEHVADLVRAKNPIFYLSFISKNAIASFRQYLYKKYESVRLDLKIEVEYNCIGWTQDMNGKPIYVSHHLMECISENRRKLENIEPSEVNSILDWGIDFLEVGQKIETILPIWLYSFYGFSIPLLQEVGLQTQLIMMVRGRSGSLKTALGKVLFSLFELKNNNLNFQSTKVAVESGLSEARDNGFLWDDIYDAKHPSTKHFLELVRCIADNIGRSRMNMRTGKKEQFFYRLGLIVTAENSIGEQMSGRLRYIVSNVEKNSFIGERLALYQADAEKSLMEGRGNKLEKHYSLYVFFLQNNFLQLKEDLKIWISTLNGNFRERRMNAAYQCFMAVAFLVAKFHYSYHPNDHESFRRRLELSEKIVFDLIAENEREASIVEDYKLWCQIISDGLASGEVSIAKNCEEYSKGGGNFLGYHFSEQELALEPNKTFAYVKKIAESRYSNAMVISKSNVEKRLDEERIIIGYDEKNGDRVRRRHLKRVVIAGLSSRVLMVDVGQFRKTVTSLTEEI